MGDRETRWERTGGNTHRFVVTVRGPVTELQRYCWAAQNAQQYLGPGTLNAYGSELWAAASQAAQNAQASPLPGSYRFVGPLGGIFG